MSKNVDRFVVYNLRETYAELGEYEFKIVLNPRFFKNSHESLATVVDSDGKPMRYDLKKWGRKMNIRFTVEEETSDGVASVRLMLIDENGDGTPGHVTFWVIK